jgi:hypothetical protein
LKIETAPRRVLSTLYAFIARSGCCPLLLGIASTCELSPHLSPSDRVADFAAHLRLIRASAFLAIHIPATLLVGTSAAGTTKATTSD